MRISGLGKEKARAEKHESKPVTAYNTATDSTLTPVKVKGEKRKADDDGVCKRLVFVCVCVLARAFAIAQWFCVW